MESITGKRLEHRNAINRGCVLNLGFSPTNRLRFLARVTFFAVAALCLTPAFAKQGDGPKPPAPVDKSLIREVVTAEDCEKALKESGYLETLRENIFIVTREFRDYRAAYGARFFKLLESLRGGQIWVDFGAGEARAQLDYLNAHAEADGWISSFRRRNVRYLALSLKYPEDTDPKYRKLRAEFEASGQFQYVESSVEDMPEDDSTLYDLGSEYFGPLTYTLDLSAVVNKYLRRMRKPNESRHFFTISEMEEIGCLIELRDGRRVRFSDWLASQPGVKLEHLGIAVEGKESFYDFSKTEQNVQVPDLDLIEFRKNSRGLVVWRVFREKS